MRRFVLGALTAVLPAIGQTAPDGQQLFQSICATCHGLDARGGEHAPGIAAGSGVERMGDGAVLAIIRKGIPAAGMPSFAARLNESQMSAVLGYLRSLQGTKSALAVGDAHAGEQLFFGKGACTDCHSMNGRGGVLGPDLTGYGSGHSADAIRAAIIDPDKKVDSRRGVVTVELKSGRSLRGLVRNEDNFSLQVQMMGGEFALLEKSDIARINRETHSLMPGDYGTKLTNGELTDLVRFLAESQRVKPEAADDEQ
jgi:cytochrome c oxidase cbb3-type subunit 3